MKLSAKIVWCDSGIKVTREVQTTGSRYSAHPRERCEYAIIEPITDKEWANLLTKAGVKINAPGEIKDAALIYASKNYDYAFLNDKIEGFGTWNDIVKFTIVTRKEWANHKPTAQ